jgi:hypothetical protein
MKPAADVVTELRHELVAQAQQSVGISAQLAHLVQSEGGPKDIVDAWIGNGQAAAYATRQGRWLRRLNAHRRA